MRCGCSVGTGPQTPQASSRASRVHVCDTCVSRGKMVELGAALRGNRPKATGPSLRDLGNRPSSNPRPRPCWGWLRCGSGLSPSPRCWSEPQPSEPAPCTAEAALAGRPLLARGGQGRPRDQEKRSSPELWSSGFVRGNKTRVSASNSRRRTEGRTGGAVRRPRLRPSQQGSHAVTPSRRGRDFMGHGTPARTDSRQQPEPRQQVRTGPGQRPFCTRGLACGHRYLTRFSTEYTDM